MNKFINWGGFGLFLSLSAYITYYGYRWLDSTLWMPIGVIISCVLANSWISYLNSEKVEGSDTSDVSRNKITKPWFTKQLIGRPGKIGIIILFNLSASLLARPLWDRFADITIINLVLVLLMILRKEWISSLTFAAMFLCGYVTLMSD